MRLCRKAQPHNRGMKVFVSSLIGDLEPLRRAARDAIVSLGHEPLPSEDRLMPPLAPQQACLDGVRRADLIVLILTDRYGLAQSHTGMSAPHEEYLEARGLKPILLFVQGGIEPEPRQAYFLEAAQGSHGSTFCERFRSAE